MKLGDKITVRDPASDDFGVPGQHIRPQVVDEHYCYHHNWWWRLLSAFIYYIVAPLPVHIMGWAHGLRFRNRAALRKAGGCYLYCNHTHWLDAVIPYLVSFPRRAYVVAGPTAFSIPVLRQLVALLGGVPLNTTPAGKMAFREAIGQAVKRGDRVAIYPEAHEWPYYNGIRPFPPYAFTYPVHDEAPVVAGVVTYRRRRFFSKRAPHLTLTLSEPITPADWQGAADPKTALRDTVHDFMCDTARQQASYAWVEYLSADGSPA